MEGQVGFEPTTYALQERRSGQLSYNPMFKVVIRAGTFSTTTNEWLFTMVIPRRLELRTLRLKAACSIHLS